MQPGQSISPTEKTEDQPPQQSPTYAQQITPNPSAPQPQQQPVQTPTQPSAQPTVQEQTPQPEKTPQTPPPQTKTEVNNTPDGLVSWSASDYIQHQKPKTWLPMLFLGGGLLSAVAFLVTRDVISSVVVVFATIMFAIGGMQKPRTRNYAITEDAVIVEGKKYAFDDFKSFALFEEGMIDSVQLFPLKVGVPVSMYFPPDMAEQIINELSLHLPHEEREHTLVDQLMKRLKF